MEREMDTLKLLELARQAVRDVTGIDDPSLGSASEDRWSPDAEAIARMRRAAAYMLEYQKLASIGYSRLLMKHAPTSPDTSRGSEAVG